MSSYIKLDVSYDDSVLDEFRDVFNTIRRLCRHANKSFIVRRDILWDKVLPLPEDLSEYFVLERDRDGTYYYCYVEGLGIDTTHYNQYKTLRDYSSDGYIYAKQQLVQVHKDIFMLAAKKDEIKGLYVKYLGGEV